MASKKLLLLVEDDPATRYVMKAILRGMGSEYEVISESSHDGAVAALRMASVDLMITDLVLSSQDGVAVTRELRAHDSDLPVIWLTGYGCEHFEREAQELGVYCCLDKPAPASLVRRVVREALQGHGPVVGRGAPSAAEAINGDG